MDEKFYGPWFHCVSSMETEVDNKQENNSTHKQLKVVTNAMWAASSVHGYRWGEVSREQEKEVLIKTIPAETWRVHRGRSRYRPWGRKNLGYPGAPVCLGKRRKGPCPDLRLQRKRKARLDPGGQEVGCGNLYRAWVAPQGKGVTLILNRWQFWKLTWVYAMVWLFLSPASQTHMLKPIPEGDDIKTWLEPLWS